MQEVPPYLLYMNSCSYYNTFKGKRQAFLAKKNPFGKKGFRRY